MWKVYHKKMPPGEGGKIKEEGNEKVGGVSVNIIADYPEKLNPVDFVRFLPLNVLPLERPLYDSPLKPVLLHAGLSFCPVMRLYASRAA
jgi:hypothetical protein